jgi:hypothetical protein
MDDIDAIIENERSPEWFARDCPPGKDRTAERPMQAARPAALSMWPSACAACGCSLRSDEDQGASRCVAVAYLLTHMGIWAYHGI